MAPAGYPTCILGATAEAPRQGHGSATQPNKPKKNPETRHKRIRGHPPPDREGGTRKESKNLKGTIFAGLSDHNRQTAFLGLVSISANALVTPYSTHNESWAPDFNRLSEGGRDCTGGRSIQRRADTKQRNQRRRERREGRPGQEKRMSHTQQEQQVHNLTVFKGEPGSS